MKKTKPEIENAVLALAGEFNVAVSFSFLMKTTSLPEIVRLITYYMFLNKFDFRSCNKKLYEAYCIVFDYATELKNNGSVILK